MSTIEERGLKFIGREVDKVRGTVADLYIEPANAPGPRSGSNCRHLIVRYESGGRSDLPLVDGKREFASGIPNDWSEEQILRHVQKEYGF